MAMPLPPRVAEESDSSGSPIHVQHSRSSERCQTWSPESTPPPQAVDRASSDGTGAEAKSLASQRDVMSAVREIASHMKHDLALLAPSIEFLNSVEGIKAQVDVGPRNTMQDMVSQLESFTEVIHMASERPETISSHPLEWGIPGEATLRARLGVKFISKSWAGVVAEKLEEIGEESEMLRKAAKHIIASFRQLSEALNLCTTRIRQTILCCAAVQREVQKLSSTHVINIEAFDSRKLRAGLDVVPFQSAMKKLDNLPVSLSPVADAIQKRVGMLQTFTDGAPAEVHASFQLPFPGSLVQASLLGEEPPLLMSLQQQLLSMRQIRLGSVLEVLFTVTQSVLSLNTEVAFRPVKEFTEKAKRRLDRLDLLLCEAGLGYAKEAAEHQEQAMTETDPDQHVLLRRMIGASTAVSNGVPLSVDSEVGKRTESGLTDEVAQEHMSQSPSFRQVAQERTPVGQREEATLPIGSRGEEFRKGSSNSEPEPEHSSPFLHQAVSPLSEMGEDVQEKLPLLVSEEDLGELMPLPGTVVPLRLPSWDETANAYIEADLIDLRTPIYKKVADNVMVFFETVDKPSSLTIQDGYDEVESPPPSYMGSDEFVEK